MRDSGAALGNCILPGGHCIGRVNRDFDDILSFITWAASGEGWGTSGNISQHKVCGEALADGRLVHGAAGDSWAQLPSQERAC